ncbi:MAG: HD domain-containing phosphohydrolase [Planctomycetota bacterium]
MIDPEAIRGLLTAIELKDAATAAHTWRVTLYARALAETLGLTGERLRLVTVGAALHDVGKIDIDDAVLRKAGSLDDDEFAVIRTHTTLGYDRLRSMGVDEPVILGLVRSHHERCDGSGYPDGLVGNQIPLEARYLAVVDAFDAMTSIRPYRDEVGEPAALVAIDDLQQGAGTRYCARSVEAFATLFRTGALDWILHYYNDGAETPGFDAIEHLDDAIRALRSS